MATSATAKKTKFLSALGKSGNVSRAAQWCGVDRRTPYRWRDADPEFAAQWDDSRESGIDDLEERALEIALTGDSPALTIFMLKSLRRETYGEHQVIEHAGSIGLESVLAGGLGEVSGG